MDIIIRKAVMSDIETLTVLLAELFSIEDDFEIDPAKQKKALSIIICGENGGTIFVSETGSHIIGMVNLQKVVSTAAGGLSVLLEDLYVKPEFRNKGIGKMLLDQAADWGRDQNALRIQLAADLRNKQAISFYERQNFKISRMTLHYKSIS